MTTENNPKPKKRHPMDTALLILMGMIVLGTLIGWAEEGEEFPIQAVIASGLFLWLLMAIRKEFFGTKKKNN